MIFVTVGTHEQQFNRLVEYMDMWAENHDEKVIIQSGYSTYEPKNCEWKKLLPYDEMNNLIEKARIVITHGGPSSFVAPLMIGKTPIVVPRKKEFGEHVNDHQVRFCRQVEDRIGSIIVIEDINELGELIDTYEESIIKMSRNMKSNNNAFCDELSSIVDRIIRREN